MYLYSSVNINDVMFQISVIENHGYKKHDGYLVCSPADFLRVIYSTEALADVGRGFGLESFSPPAGVRTFFINWPDP